MECFANLSDAQIWKGVSIDNVLKEEALSKQIKMN